nr:MAG TPA: hypothetical protein [Caudoviricetes sp.]
MSKSQKCEKPKSSNTDKKVLIRAADKKVLHNNKRSVIR